VGTVGAGTGAGSAVGRTSGIGERAARAGLWALPVCGALLGVSTLTHQPPVADFDAYARYTTTGAFLASHLGASIGGAAAAVLGAAALTALLVRGRAAATAVSGFVLAVLAQVFLSAAFGSAAFVQPGIGRAHLNGVPGMAALNVDTAYGPALVATALTSTAFFIISAIVLGTAIARTHRALRWYGIAYAAFLVVFAGPGVLYGVLQPIAGFAHGRGDRRTSRPPAPAVHRLGRGLRPVQQHRQGHHR
jgi:hypothetical protein